MDLGLKGKVALVTGGSRMIGYNIARRLGLEGAKVAICARGETALLRATEKLRAEGVDVWGRVTDVSEPEQVRSLVAEVVNRFGGLGILINNPGGYVKPGPFSSVEPQHWRRGFEVNVVTVVSVTQEALPHLKADEWGRVVNMGAFYLAPGVPKLLNEMAENVVAKISVSALTKVMAEELAPSVTVNCIAPGPVGADHPMRGWCDGFPVPRPADPSEIADLVAFLCSRQAGYLTGLTVPFDGGDTRRVV
ncbi:MAG: SDR family oxidoreductase [bacterium]|nr:SDR family oxidoreductase [bacterium]